MSANLENSAVAIGLERSAFIPTPKKGNVAFISHASKVMLKFLQAKIQQYVWSSNFHLHFPKANDVKLDFLVAQTVKNLPAMQETRVWSLGWEDPLETGDGFHGNPLQYSFWENPMDTGFWRATVYGLIESDTTEHIKPRAHLKL